MLWCHESNFYNSWEWLRFSSLYVYILFSVIFNSSSVTQIMYHTSIWNKLLWSDQIAVPLAIVFCLGRSELILMLVLACLFIRFPSPRLKGSPYTAIFRAGSNTDSCLFESKHLWNTTKAIADARAFIQRQSLWSLWPGLGWLPAWKQDRKVLEGVHARRAGAWKH